MSLDLDENTFLDLQGSTIMDEQCDPFTLAETTGRPSILRISPKEKFPPKSSLKSPKVSFQTPVRDPVARKVLSPHLTNICDGNIAFEEAGKVEEKVRNTEGPGNLDMIEKKGNRDSGGTSDVPGSNLEMRLKPVSGVNETTANDVGLGDEEQILSKGTYAFDLDMLDAINPFQGVSKVLNSPATKLSDTQLDCQEQCTKISSVTDQTLPQNTEQMPKATPCNSNAEHGINASADISSQVESQSNNVQDSELIKSQTMCNFEEDRLEKIDPCASEIEVQISQLPPKDSYNLDFDNIDSINPFQTGGPKLQNSPSGQDLLCQNITKDVVDADPVQPVRLETEFNDLVEGEKKPPLKKLGQRPGGRVLLKKPGVTTKKTARSKSEKPNKEVGKLNETGPADPLVLKIGYNVEGAKLDDPNFNPFGGGSKICNSPSSAKLPAANSDELHSLQDTVENVEPIAKEVDEGQKPTSVSRITSTSGVPTEARKQTAKKNTCKVKPMMEVSPVQLLQDPVPSSAAGNITDTRLVADHTRVQPRGSDREILGINDIYFMRRSSAFLNAIIAGEAEEFRPIDRRSPVSAFNQPKEMTRLELLQHSVLHTPDLRFDPLLRESPVRLTVEAIETQSDPTTSSSTIVDLETRLITNQESNEMNIMEMVDIATLIPDGQSNLINPRADFTSATIPAEDAIEVLKYSQKDMDAAILVVKQEVTNEKTITFKWIQKYEEILAQCAEMKVIVDEYSETIFEMMEEIGTNSELAKAELEKVTEEKQQALKELSSVQKSFSEFFKRFESLKETLEGYQKNEETLKKCAQQYIERIKKEEQRYQTLKVHAAEKLNQANETIAQVRKKFKAEIAALQAQLHKEQMRANSMERSLEEMVRLL
uniref:transforming acidic coiled-coil-containing protein 3-like isoform X2 n=2 Tax=Pristiophorus japonicus TaxID=55135 RepID=UPI00398EAA1F